MTSQRYYYGIEQPYGLNTLDEDGYQHGTLVFFTDELSWDQWLAEGCDQPIVTRGGLREEEGRSVMVHQLCLGRRLLPPEWASFDQHEAAGLTDEILVDLYEHLQEQLEAGGAGTQKYEVYWPAEKVQELYTRLDHDLQEAPRPERFKPGEGIYVLGDSGAVRETDWNRIFREADAPDGFMSAYLLISNDDMTAAEVADIPLLDWKDKLAGKAGESDLDLVFWTEADGDGRY